MERSSRRPQVGARLILCLVATFVLSCEPRAPLPAPEEPLESAASTAEPTPLFQLWLDDAGIDFALPPSGKAVLVNIPAFELIAFEDGTPVFRSRVIVGTPWNETPVLQTYSTAVRFRPSWRPTPEMVASGEYRDRVVPPGRNNPLGLAALRLEPGLLVYLHDTDRRELFGLEERALSHGCVRVQRWDALVGWLLDVDLATVHDWAEGRRTFDHPTPPVPVTLGYYTTFPDDSGTLHHYADIYGRMANEPKSASADATAGPGCRA